MTLCTRCGTFNPEQSARCTRCGALLKPSTTATTTAATSAGQTSARSAQDGASETMLRIFIALCILFCTPCGIYGLYCQHKARSASADEARAYTQKGVKVCKIGLCVVGVLFLLSAIFG